MKKIIILNTTRVVVDNIVVYYPSNYDISLKVIIVKEGLEKNLSIHFDNIEEINKAVNLLDEHFLIKQLTTLPDQD